MTSSPSMLQGIRVADMSTVIFGPYATQVLADLGADVIKVEPTGMGDAIRIVGTPPKTPGMSPLHLRLNRGKRSVDWDLRTEEGRAALHRLIESSDVFIHNVRADAMERLGFDYDAVRALKPDIIYVHCTGFDQRGPYAGLQAYDDIIQAAAGVATLLPHVDGNPRPRYLPMTLADKVSGLHAAYAVAAALVHRLRTGQGQFVEVPMFEAVASFNLLEHLFDRTFVPPTGPARYARQVDPTRQPMPTKDGWIAIAPYLDDRWVRFFEAVGRADVLKEARFIDGPTRRRNMAQMYELMYEITPSRTTDEWLALLAKINVPAMRVNDIEDLLEDPQLKASGLLQPREHPTEGGYLEVRAPVRFSAWPGQDLPHAAAVGQHSEALARELGVVLPSKAAKA
ncbi:MAG TPA: CoA transferase [Candidatus Aquabacterium excrementipullorum]|nr:CoA transferase [Candidatus Aquabacterium excrementipullorum]